MSNTKPEKVKAAQHKVVLGSLGLLCLKAGVLLNGLRVTQHCKPFLHKNTDICCLPELWSVAGAVLWVVGLVGSNLGLKMSAI